MTVIAPYLQQHGRNSPKVDGFLTVNVPGEILRFKVMKVITNDLVEGELLSVPMGRNPENLHKGDIVTVHRTVGDHGIEAWNLLTEREVQQNIRRHQLEQEQAEAAAAKERERIQAIRDRDLAQQAAEAKPKRTAAKKPVSRRRATAKRKA
jgi:hypothetical protein